MGLTLPLSVAEWSVTALAGPVVAAGATKNSSAPISCHPDLARVALDVDVAVDELVETGVDRGGPGRLAVVAGRRVAKLGRSSGCRRRRRSWRRPARVISADQLEWSTVILAVALSGLGPAGREPPGTAAGDHVPRKDFADALSANVSDRIAVAGAIAVTLR